MAEDLSEQQIPMSGQVLMPTGLAALVRIPVPGTNLCIELDPRGWVPKGGSTSTLFFQDIKGKKHLRLDYGFNVKTNSVNYHWNANNSTGHFGYGDHQVAGAAGKYVYQAAKYFKWGGRIIGIVGMTLDAVSVVQADRPMRRATEVVSAWALARVGCVAVGEYGAGVGVAGGPYGIAAGGIGGCLIGGIAGYWAGEKMAQAAFIVYDWADETVFTPLLRAAEFEVNAFVNELGTPRW